MREESRLRIYEIRILRIIFGPKRDEVTKKRRELHNEELRDPNSSPNIARIIKLRRVRWVEHAARMGRERRDVYRGLMGKPEGEKPLARPRRKWEENIKVDLQEVRWGEHGLD